MDIVVNEELKAYIDLLTPDEYESLERSLLGPAAAPQRRSPQKPAYFSPTPCR